MKIRKVFRYVGAAIAIFALLYLVGYVCYIFLTV